MNPCFWTKNGNVRPDTFIPVENTDRVDLLKKFHVPCRTVCGNGILDIEEECEPYSGLLKYTKNTYFDGCLWDRPKKEKDHYSFCSDQCMCKEGWERNPDYD